jgi:hypothetical protein
MSYQEDFKTLLQTFSTTLSEEERHKLDQQDTWEHLLSPVVKYEPKLIKLSTSLGKPKVGKLIRSIATSSDISFDHIKLTKTIPTLEKLRTIYINIIRNSITPPNLHDIIWNYMDYSL